MKVIIADRHFNFHSPSTPGGLIHVPARRAVRVPDDVFDYPGFEDLIKHGHVAEIGGAKARKIGAIPAPKQVGKSPDDPTSLIPNAKDVDSGDDEDDEDEDDEDDALTPASKPVTAPKTGSKK